MYVYVTSYKLAISGQTKLIRTFFSRTYLYAYHIVSYSTACYEYDVNHYLFMYLFICAGQNDQEASTLSVKAQTVYSSYNQ